MTERPLSPSSQPGSGEPRDRSFLEPTPVPEMAAVVGEVAVYELWGPGRPELLWPEEEALVVDAVPARVTQFAAGRQCARAALAALGVEPGPLPRGPGRSVAWPIEVWGAITHTEGYAAAVVGLRTERSGPVGVDAERVGRVEANLHPRLFVPEERAWLDGLDPAVQILAATELFGLKECFYKAQFPLTGAWVGFHDVRIDGPETAAFAEAQRRWRLRPITSLPALEAVDWPCSGWSMTRGPGADIALTVVSAPLPTA